MPPLSSQRLRRRSNKALRELVMELAEERRSRSMPDVETAASMSKSISQNKPPVFTGAGEPVILENWLREFDKIFNVVQCPEHLRVDQAAFYLQEEADYWWSNTRDNLMGDPHEPLQWKEFKRVIREKFYPPHIRKQKSNEFSKLEMGYLTVDEYYKKFMEYVKYCPDDVPTEEQKMQRFELGLSNEIQVHVDSDRYTTLDAMYQRAAQVGSLLHKDKGKKPEISSVGVNSGDKRKENFQQQHHFQQNKKHMGFSSFERNGKLHHRGFNSQKKNGDTNSKERVYFCRRCPNNHPGKDCNGNLVECNVCGKLGHRGFECYAKHGRPNQKIGGQHNVNQKNFGNQRNGSDYRAQSLHRPKNGNGYWSNPSNFKPGESNGRNPGSAGTSGLTTQATPGRLTAISTKEAEHAKDVVTGLSLQAVC